MFHLSVAPAKRIALNVRCRIAGKLAFAATRRDPSSAFGASPVDVWVMSADSSEQRNLTNDSSVDAHPAWSPDGARIVFVSTRPDPTDGFYSHKTDIWVMAADGSNQQNLTADTFVDAEPAWSRDGNKLAFVSTRPAQTSFVTFHRSDIWVMNADGTNQVNLTHDEWIDAHPTWSPDGTKIAFVATRPARPDMVAPALHTDIWVMNADGTNQVNLTQDEWRDSDPAWSPDGTKILFVSERADTSINATNVVNRRSDIWVMDTHGLNQTRLTDDAWPEFDPTWSPDGTRIAYVANRPLPSGPMSTLQSDLWLMNADGTAARNITQDEGIDASPSWWKRQP